MHQSTLHSIEEIFSIRRKAATEVTTTTDVPERLMELIQEAKKIIAQLEQAIVSLGNSASASSDAQTTVDGVFDGKRMIADDGTAFPVPENYASKSRLIEGDLLQLVKNQDGRSYFKQISRAPRATIAARLERIDVECGTAVAENGTQYKILHSPLRFFRTAPGDRLTLEVPQDGGTWAAIARVSDA